MNADRVLTNGVVYTVDADRSRHEAVAVSGGRIVCVGSAADIEPFVGPRTQVVDLAGRLVLPGFVDAHMHPKFASDELFQVMLGGGRSFSECVAAIERFAAEHPELPAIQGFGWDPATLPEDKMTAAVLDAVVPDRPVAFFDDGGHSQWVNSTTLRRLGITRDTADPAGGVIERLADGTPSGMLREMWTWVDRVLPEPDTAQRAAGIRHFQRNIAGRYGMTTVHESGVRPDEPTAAAYEQLQKEDALTTRFCISIGLEPDLSLDQQLEAALQRRGRLAAPPLQCRTVKLYADGVIEAHTAWLKEPYADRPGYCGEHIWEAEALAEASVAAARAGFQLHYHAIGDAAVTMSLDAIAAARAATGNVHARDMITHLQLVDPRDIPRFASLGVTALPQPYWFGKEPVYAAMYVPFLGVDRADHQYPVRSFWDHGVPVASASDYPVSPPPNPLLAIQRGLLRRHVDEPGACEELWPEEAVGVEQMVESFTINGAYANFLEDETGSIEVGKSADLTVLSHDILDIPPETIHQAEVLLTVFRGAPVYATGPFAGLETV